MNSPRQQKGLWCRLNCSGHSDNFDLKANFSVMKEGLLQEALHQRRGRFWRSQRRYNFLDEVAWTFRCRPVKLLRVCRKKGFSRWVLRCYQCQCRIYRQQHRNLRTRHCGGTFSCKICFTGWFVPHLFASSVRAGSDINPTADHFTFEIQQGNGKMLKKYSTAAIESISISQMAG